MLLFIGALSSKKDFHQVFQYISCCYLSLRLEIVKVACTCFNTSHVVIYPTPDGLQVAVKRCFNTSHVVIYR